jgi:hypothetical protein
MINREGGIECMKIYSVLVYDRKAVGLRLTDGSTYYDVELNSLRGLTKSHISQYKTDNLESKGDLLVTKDELNSNFIVKDMSNNTAFTESVRTILGLTTSQIKSEKVSNKSQVLCRVLNLADEYIGYRVSIKGVISFVSKTRLLEIVKSGVKFSGFAITTDSKGVVVLKSETLTLNDSYLCPELLPENGVLTEDFVKNIIQPNRNILSTKAVFTLKENRPQYYDAIKSSVGDLTDLTLYLLGLYRNDPDGFSYYTLEEMATKDITYIESNGSKFLFLLAPLPNIGDTGGRVSFPIFKLDLLNRSVELIEHKFVVHTAAQIYSMKKTYLDWLKPYKSNVFCLSFQRGFYPFKILFDIVSGKQLTKEYATFGKLDGLELLRMGNKVCKSIYPEQIPLFSIDFDNSAHTLELERSEKLPDGSYIIQVVESYTFKRDFEITVGKSRVYRVDLSDGSSKLLVSDEDYSDNYENKNLSENDGKFYYSGKLLF